MWQRRHSESDIAYRLLFENTADVSPPFVRIDLGSASRELPPTREPLRFSRPLSPARPENAFTAHSGGLRSADHRPVNGSHLERRGAGCRRRIAEIAGALTPSSNREPIRGAALTDGATWSPAAPLQPMSATASNADASTGQPGPQHPRPETCSVTGARIPVTFQALSRRERPDHAA